MCSHHVPTVWILELKTEKKIQDSSAEKLFFFFHCKRMWGSKFAKCQRSFFLLANCTYLLLSCFCSFFKLLKGRETDFQVKVMARIVWREFPPLRKTLQDVWHCRHLVALPKHVILISHGSCTNLTSSNWNHLIRRCCTLWPNFPRHHARKKLAHLKMRLLSHCY